MDKRLPVHFKYVKSKKGAVNKDEIKVTFVAQIEGYQSPEVSCFTADKPLSKLLK